MNRNIIILICICGLIVIGLVALIVRATGGAAPSASLQNDVPEKYTYKDMIEQGEQGFRTEERKPAFADTAPPDNVMNITQQSRIEPSNNQAPEVGPDAREAQEAIAEIKATKARLKQQQPIPPENEAAEDEQIRNILAAHQATPAPSDQATPPPAKPAGFNTLNFGAAGASTGKAKGSAVAVKGVVLNNVQVVTGSSVRIMLLENVIVNEVQLNKTQIVTGSISVEDTRVKIHVPGTAVNGQLAEVAFSAYGTDGIEGLRIEGNKAEATKQAAKEEIERNIDQAAGGGILGGVVRVVKTLGAGNKTQQLVNIPAGSKLILKIETQ